MNHEMKEHGQTDQMKKEHMKMHQEMHDGMKGAMHGKEGCCCCAGDSCDMKMTHQQEKAKG
jgi:hypothetical protein